MRGMILAAGRGARMGSLTDATPKPLLRVGKRYLIEYAIFALVQAGIREIIINICYHKEKIKAALGDGARYGATFYYSEETEALETGGGVLQALPLLGTHPFIILSSDIITDYPLQNLLREPAKLAHLVLVDNPSFHPQGDFCLRDNLLFLAEQNHFTFSNIGLYRPELFAGYTAGKFRLGDVLKQAVTKAQVTGEYYRGLWHNVGTPVQLEEATYRGA